MLQVSDGLAKLLRTTKRIPPLDVDEEVRLFKQWYSTGDAKAKARIIEASMRHVVALAIMYRNYPIPTEELVSEGSLGLIHAFDKFDLKRGHRFVTYAAFWIKARMYNAIMAYHLENHTQGNVRSEHFYRYRRARSKAENLYGKSEQAEAHLAKALKLTSTQLTKLSRIMDWPDLSIDVPMYDDKYTTLGDMLECDGDNPEEQAVGNRHTNGVGKAVRKVLGYLDRRERYIAENRLMRFPDEAKTLAEIGRELGISRERARQLEVRAKRKLKVHLHPLRNLLAP